MVVTLTPGDYWRLRVLTRDVEVREADLLRAHIAGRQAIEQAKRAAADAFDQLASAGLDPATAYRWDDDACTLTPAE